MATAIDRRRPDNRRASLLAATKAGRERGEAALPAHRAGRRPPVDGPGLRRQLALHAVAVTSIVAIAFLIPLALLVQQVAHERALARAERQTAIVVSVLAVTTDPGAVEQLVTAASGQAGGGLAVHGLVDDVVGTGHALPDDINSRRR